MKDLFTPSLTEFDPVFTSEGSLDPLGLYQIADSMAVKLASGVRERQSHPRFLTAIAVGNVVCSEFDEDAIAVDGVSQPWQVFEWYMVEGLVRNAKDNRELLGLPGRDKTAQAIKDRVPLSVKRYLKTPGTFGFHGVYRVLAKTLDVVSERCLGELGYRIVTTWAKEQKLEGFYGSEDGRGKDVRARLVSAVRDGMEKGAVARSPIWKGWGFFSDYLNHFRCGKEEKKILIAAILDPKDDFRKQVLECLISSEGKSVWQKTKSERRFHEILVNRVSPDIKMLVEAIMEYELFARMLEDAFYECLMLMSKKNTRTLLKELSEINCVISVCKGIKTQFKKAEESLANLGEAAKFSGNFVSLVESENPTEWVRTLLEHHIKVQNEKPPNGKRPWFEQFDDGSVFIRPMYKRDKGGMLDDSYVHFYRTTPLWSFSTDLGLV